MTNTAEFWKGNFGNEYHQRNRVDWRKRIKFWTEILEITGARSVYEFGCGPGWNLSAIKAAQIRAPECYGREINEAARRQAWAAGLTVTDEDGSKHCLSFDLTFTCGVLIHIPTEDLKERMQHMIDCSSDYVLCIEYENPVEKGIDYRGHKDKLWCRPYGQMYREMGLNIVMQSNAGDGFDNCQATLLRK